MIEENPKGVPPSLLSMTEAATYVGISKATLYEWCSQRKIPHVKVGRLTKFDLRTLEKWIERRTVKARAHPLL
jgi:excisionase family DNA binding protein